MRFVAVITHRDIILARVSVDPREGETLQETAFRGRATLERDANRYRSAALSDTVLAEFGDAYRDLIAAQLLTGAGRFLTCLSREGRVYRKEGEITLLTGPGDCICLIRALDDAWIADREALCEKMLAHS